MCTFCSEKLSNNVYQQLLYEQSHKIEDRRDTLIILTKGNIWIKKIIILSQWNASTGCQQPHKRKQGKWKNKNCENWDKHGKLVGRGICISYIYVYIRPIKNFQCMFNYFLPPNASVMAILSIPPPRSLLKQIENGGDFKELSGKESTLYQSLSRHFFTV